jgi:CHAT domain-containing protein
LGEIINTIRKRSVFDRLLRAGILCLPASWQDDFIQLYGEERSFSELQSLIQSDAALRQGLLSIAHMKASDLSGVDDENRDLTKEMNEFLQTWLTFIRSFQRNGHGLELIKIASLLCSMEQLLDYPPLLLLLLGEEEAAAAWADRANNLLKHSQPESPKRQHSLSTSLIDRPSKLSPRKAFSLKLALALYYMATKNYKDACTILGNLAENLGDESLGERFQLYFLVDACHSSMNEKAAEPEALAKCIRDLDRLRATLRTRERAKILGPIRREIYERYLEVLRGSENKQEMALVLANYKKPSAKYAPPLSENATEPSMARATLQHLIFLFDVLSREQVWKPRGVFQLLAEFVGTLGFSGRSSIIDSRETTLSALNSIANVMIDETMEEAPFRPYDRTAPALPREEGELLISYFVGRKGLQVITQDAKSSTETHFVRIERAELQEMCREFLQKIKDELDVDQEAAKLFRVLLGQVEDLSSYHKLLIWPDGPLHLIPFQALKKSTDSGYLVESHIISYFSGASPIVIPTSNDNQRLSLLAVADPDGSLQSTQVEAKRIIQTLNQAKPEPLIGENATLNNISRLASGASHIHFATHGRFNSSHPGFSYLQLADRSRLYSIDLGGIAFGGKHVFLSACQTRIGEYLPGDDVYGICDAFLAAGASSVVATLWNVKDASTGEFAALYYELLSGGATPPDALSTVAQKFISQEVWLNDQGEIILLNHPRYWAAFNFILTAHE